MHSAVQLPDSRLLLVGDDVVDEEPVIRISRLFPDGSLDLAYGTGGETVTSIPDRQVHAYALGVQADGRVVVAGNSYDGDDQDIALWRFTDNGTLDGTFGDQGVSITAIGPNDLTTAMAMDDNRLFVAGGTDVFATYDVFVAAYGNGLTVGQVELDSSTELQIFPNPTSGEVRLSSPLPDLGRVEIRDATGRIVFNSPWQMNNGTLDLAALKSGIYLL